MMRELRIQYVKSLSLTRKINNSRASEDRQHNEMRKWRRDVQKAHESRPELLLYSASSKQGGTRESLNRDIRAERYTYQSFSLLSYTVIHDFSAPFTLPYSAPASHHYSAPIKQSTLNRPKAWTRKEMRKTTQINHSPLLPASPCPNIVFLALLCPSSSSLANISLPLAPLLRPWQRVVVGKQNCKILNRERKVEKYTDQPFSLVACPAFPPMLPSLPLSRCLTTPLLGPCLPPLLRTQQRVYTGNLEQG